MEEVIGSIPIRSTNHSYLFSRTFPKPYRTRPAGAHLCRMRPVSRAPTHRETRTSPVTSLTQTSQNCAS